MGNLPFTRWLRITTAAPSSAFQSPPPRASAVSLATSLSAPPLPNASLSASPSYLPSCTVPTSASTLLSCTPPPFGPDLDPRLLKLHDAALLSQMVSKVTKLPNLIGQT